MNDFNFVEKTCHIPFWFFPFLPVEVVKGRILAG